MKLISALTYEQLSKEAGNFITEYVQDNPGAVLGLATGSTPEGTYRELIRQHRENNVSFAEVVTVNLDEYVGVAPDHPNSYHHYMEEHLFKHIDINPDHVHLPNGLAEDLERECRRYDKLMAEAGGIDIQLLGIGTNGHIGFNEPYSSFDGGTHVVELTSSTREENARFFDKDSDVPKQAVTMGIKPIMKSRKILLLASGKRKAEAVKRLVQEEVNEAFPASVLKRHPDVTIVADEEALSLLTEEERSRMG